MTFGTPLPQGKRNKNWGNAEIVTRRGGGERVAHFHILAISTIGHVDVTAGGLK